MPIAAVATAVFAVIALIFTFLPSGGSTEPNGPAQGTNAPAPAPKLDDGSWTVLVYICGADLESEDAQASTNIEELATVDLPANANVVIETGGAKRWHTDGVDSDHIGRYVMKNGALTQVEQLEWASMGDESTLADFLAWGVGTYPAEHYMAVFWDHGGGPLVGVCIDERSEDGILLPEMRSAFESCGTKFDIVTFDTCLSATIETAQALQGCVDYLVASEDVVPGGGIAWDAWPGWFGSTKDPDDVVGLCKTIVDTYLTKCDAHRVGDTATMAVIDLAKIGGVAEAFARAGDVMAHATERAGNFQHLVVKADEVQSFGYADYLSGYTNVVDMGDLVRCMSDRMENEYGALTAALKQAVIYEKHGEARERCTGLTVFYPLAVDDMAYQAYDIISNRLALGNEPYLQFLSVRTGNYDATAWTDRGITNLKPVTAKDAQGAFQYAGSIDDKGAFTVRITGNTEFVQIATYQFGQVQPDGTVVPLGSGNNLGLSIDEHGQVTYVDQFQGGVLNIGGAYAYAQIVDMQRDGDTPLYNLYSVPVELTTTNFAGDAVTLETNLLVMYRYKTNDYKVLCYYESASESGMVAKTSVVPSVGDKIKFLAFREVNGTTQKGSMGTITWAEDTKVEELNPGDATYVYQIVITDIFGQKYPPVSARITYKDGQRTAELM